MEYSEEKPAYERDSDSSVSGKDLYNELKLKGYEYGPAFQTILEINTKGTNGLIIWKDKWIPFLDNLLLLFGILDLTDEFVLPTGMTTIKIDPVAFLKYLDGDDSAEDYKEEEKSVKDDSKDEEKSGEDDSKDEEKSRNDDSKVEEKSEKDVPRVTEPRDTIPVSYNPLTRTVRTPGVELQRLTTDSVNLGGKKDNATTEHYKWIPYNSHYNPDKEAQIQLDYYMGACNKKIDDVGRLLRKNVSHAKFPVGAVNESAIKDVLGDLNENHMLLKVLSEMSQNAGKISAKKGEWLSFYQDVIGMEALNHALVNDVSMRIMSEILIENSSRKLCLLEVNNGFPLVSPFLMDTVAKASTTNFKQACVVLKKERQLDNELLHKHNIQLLSQTDLPTLTSPERQQDLVISSFTNGTKDDLKKLIESLHSICKSNGFILLFHKGRLLPAEKLLFELCGTEFQVQPQSVLDEILLSRNLLVLSKITDPFGGSLYLIRPKAANETDKVIKVSESDFSWVEEAKKELYGGVRSAQRLWLVSDDPTSGVVGMVNCLRQEPRGERVRCVLVPRSDSRNKLPPFNLEDPAYKQLRDRNLVMNIWRDGAWGCYRHFTIKERKSPRDVISSYVNCRKYGDLSSLAWTESALKYQKIKNRSLVHVYYAALNYRDVMLATGQISEATVKLENNEDEGVNDGILGMEFSGRDQAGRRVCGIVRGGGMATTVQARPEFMFEIPDQWSLEEAATVPVAYTTAIYALIMRADLQRGESVLIHSGAGGVGLAAIRLALSLDCEIYTTVGTEEKRQYLLKKFPQIKPENIASSRDLSFEKMIMMRTNGRGVDVVLNSLSDDKFQASIRCVALGERYVELGKSDLAMDKKIGTRKFLDDIEFHGVSMDVVLGGDAKNTQKMQEIMDRLKDGIKKGTVQPLDRKIFKKDQVEEAFRYMAQGVHTGKILLKVRDEEPSKIVVPKPLIQPAVPITYFHKDKVYIIVGGLGGFGIQIAKWMIKWGARHIILTSRYGARTPYHKMCLERWQKGAVDVRVSKLNVGIRKEAEQLIKEASKIGPVGGIFNAAAVMKDALFDSQSSKSFKDVCESKAFATKHLDELTRSMCPELDYFVCFSSISCGRGNAGQTNYGFSNSVMERICEERRKAGLHGLAIQWGTIGQVGMVHRHMSDDAKTAGVIPQSVKSCVTVLDACLQQDGAVVSSYTTSTKTRNRGDGDTLNQIA